MKSRKICIEKKFSKYIFKKELSLLKTKSKSPSLATATDSPKSSNHKTSKKYRKSSELNGTSTKIFVPIINDENDPFSFDNKTNIKENPFLSNIKQKHLFAMNINKTDTQITPSLFNNDIKSNSFMTLSSKIKANNNLANFAETNMNSNFFDSKSDINEKNNTIFSNTLINTDLYDSFLHSISASSSNSNSSTNIKNNSNNKNSNNSKLSNEDKNNSENFNFYSLENLSEKEKVIIQALIDLNKDNLYKKEEEIDNFDFDLEDYYFNKKYKNILSSYSSEEDIEFEKNVYEFIDNRIKLYFKNYKKSKSHVLDEKKNEIKKFNYEIKKILIYEQKIEKFSCIGFKSIVMSLFSLIIDLLSNSNFSLHLKRIKNKDMHILPFNNDKFIFITLMGKYNKIKELCPYIEKDFKDIIENFQNEKKMKISLSDLFTDLYWDYAFKIHNINNKFINGFLSNNNNNNLTQEESKSAMGQIIDILISCEIPYKKNIGELLSLPYMNKESIFLMNYILKYKKNYNTHIINNNPLIEKKEEISYINKENKENEEKEINDNNKEQKEYNENNTENFSLEEVYNYILADDGNEQKNKKKNKRHKRRRKNKNDNDKNKENNKENEKNINNTNMTCDDDNYIDPVVEEFVQYFKDFNKTNVDCVKIKPVISEEWIKSIS